MALTTHKLATSCFHPQSCLAEFYHKLPTTSNGRLTDHFQDKRYIEFDKLVEDAAGIVSNWGTYSNVLMGDSVAWHVVTTAQGSIFEQSSITPVTF